MISAELYFPRKAVNRYCGARIVGFDGSGYSENATIKGMDEVSAQLCNGNLGESLSEAGMWPAEGGDGGQPTTA